MNHKNKYYSGILTGAVSATVFQPIDSLRSRFFFDYKLGTFKSLYNGYLYNLTTTCIKACASFPLQDHIKSTIVKHNVKNNNNLGEYKVEVISCIMSGTILGLVSSPLSSIKVPLQANRKKLYMADIIRDIKMKYGNQGFIRGTLPTILRDNVWACSYFPMFKYLTERQEKSLTNNIKASLISGTIAMTCSYPFDGVRLYRQNTTKDYKFMHGFYKSFSINKNNFSSYVTSLLRVPLGLTFNHMIYLFFVEKMNK